VEGEVNILDFGIRKTKVSTLNDKENMEQEIRRTKLLIYLDDK
jgi:hypothetical protein